MFPCASLTKYLSLNDRKDFKCCLSMLPIFYPSAPNISRWTPQLHSFSLAEQIRFSFLSKYLKLLLNENCYKIFPIVYPLDVFIFKFILKLKNFSLAVKQSGITYE